ncbi:hypothetical protein FRC02_007397, partial [Tulasnella sp. 418]
MNGRCGMEGGAGLCAQAVGWGRLHVEALLEGKKLNAGRHFQMDWKVGRREDAGRVSSREIREYYKEGAKEWNAVMDKLHEAHSYLAEDHKILQRKYTVVASERKSWLAQVEQFSVALQEASTAKKRDADRCASLPSEDARGGKNQRQSFLPPPWSPARRHRAPTHRAPPNFRFDIQFSKNVLNPNISLRPVSSVLTQPPSNSDETQQSS